MEIKTTLLWSLINDKTHGSLEEKERTIEGVMPLIKALFPGINYYSITGFNQVMCACVLPVLKKRYPELLTTPEEKITPGAMTEVATVLPSKGYEWQDSTEWQSGFQNLLAVA